MSDTTFNFARHTGRTLRPVLAVAGCQAVAPASFYFGYWFSHRRR
ncbi:MAG: hypothetical protein K0S77_3213 [Pseudomonas sp.]|jgi:hypothetical protein|nr:hypothetical protein [Pseudomonas sp.]